MVILRIFSVTKVALSQRDNQYITHVLGENTDGKAKEVKINNDAEYLRVYVELGIKGIRVKVRKLSKIL